MMKLSKGGMVLTGIGAYLILSKGISSCRGIVKDICEAIKWRAYYGCERPDPLAPGYERVSENKITQDGGTPAKPENDPISDSIKKAVDNLFDNEKQPEEASESAEEACEEKCYVDYSENPDGELVFVNVPTTDDKKDEDNETVD